MRINKYSKIWAKWIRILESISSKFFAVDCQRTVFVPANLRIFNKLYTSLRDC